MARLNDILKIVLQFPEGPIVSRLSQNEITFSKEKDDDFGYSQKVIGQVSFYNDVERTFDRLYRIQQDRTVLIKILMQVYTKDDKTGAETLRQTYEVNPYSGNYDLDKCIVTLQPTLVDKFECLSKIAGARINLLEATQKQELTLIEGEIQEHVCVEQAPSNPPVWILSSVRRASCTDITLSQGWVAVKNEVFGVSKVDGGFGVDTFRSELSIRTTYKREFIAGPTQPAPDWIEVTGGWARPLTAKYDALNSTDLSVFATDNYPNEIIQTWIVVGIDSETGDKSTIDNGVPMSSALELFLENCNLTVVSDFLNINPDGTAPKNIAYDYAEQYLHEILIFQASDVIRASALNNATRLEISFLQFWKNLQKFNVEIIKSPDNQLRIEHVSYRNRERQYSLFDQFIRIKGKATFDYDELKTPQYETFSDKYATEGRDFDEALIEYPSFASNGETDPYEAPNTVSNLEYLYDNELISQDIEKMRDTFVMVSTKNGVINSSIGAITNSKILNGPMAWANIISNLWLWDRPRMSGIMNGTDTAFESAIPVRVQPDIVFKMCVSDFFENYDEDGMLEAQFGWSEIESSEYKLPDKSLTVSLIF